MKTFSYFNRFLFLFIASVALMVIVRVLFSGNLRYVSMLWNIFLGWIPYSIAGLFAGLQKKEKWKQGFIFFSWLIFFPNALYMVTDLVHLNDDSNVPLWYDAFLLFASSFVGIMMAFVSLRKVENYLKVLFNNRTMAFIIPLILFLSSYGVYLGRFERWNSWDIISSPLELSLSVAASILSPLDNYRVWLTTFLFTGIYSLLYFSMKILPYAFSENKHTGR